VLRPAAPVLEAGAVAAASVRVHGKGAGMAGNPEQPPGVKSPRRPLIPPESNSRNARKGAHAGHTDRQDT